MRSGPLHPGLLRTAIILVDRPVVGSDGPRARTRLSAIVRLRANVLNVGPVSCLVEAEAVAKVARVARAPTWADLEAAWQDLALLIAFKIRAGELERATTEDIAVVRITPADIGNFPWAPGRSPSASADRR